MSEKQHKEREGSGGESKDGTGCDDRGRGQRGERQEGGTRASRGDSCGEGERTKEP